MIFQYQRFQLGGRVEEIEVETSTLTGKQYVLLQDVQDVFPTAARFERDGRPVKFQSDENGNRLEPLRISCHPDAVLQVIPVKQNLFTIPKSQNNTTPIREESTAAPVALFSRQNTISEEHWRDYLVQRAVRMVVLLAASLLTVLINHVVSRWSSRVSAFFMVALYWKVVSMALLVLSVGWFLMLIFPLVEVVWFLVTTPILMRRSVYQRLFDF